MPHNTLQPKTRLMLARNFQSNKTSLKFDKNLYLNIHFLYSTRRTSVFSGIRVNRSFSSDVEATAGSSYGSRISVVGNRIQLFAEDEPVTETPSDQCNSRPTLEEAQEMLCYKRTDNTRSAKFLIFQFEF